MEIRIKVEYRSNKSGAGKLRASCRGMQRTIPYPHELATRMKYHRAAQELQYRLERKFNWHLRLLKVELPDENWDVFVYEVFDQTVPIFANQDAMNLGQFPAGYQRG